METSKRVALAELHSQLAQPAAEQTRLAARVEEHEREWRPPGFEMMGGSVGDPWSSFHQKKHRPASNRSCKRRRALRDVNAGLHRNSGGRNFSYTKDRIGCTVLLRSHRLLSLSTAFRNYGNVFCQPRSGVRE